MPQEWSEYRGIRSDYRAVRLHVISCPAQDVQQKTDLTENLLTSMTER